VGEDITPIFRLAPERTIDLSAFSKTLAPGIRLARVAAPQPIIARLAQAKQEADLHTGTLADDRQRLTIPFLLPHASHICDWLFV